jgi:hypothetical protein
MLKFKSAGTQVRQESLEPNAPQNPNMAFFPRLNERIGRK